MTGYETTRIKFFKSALEANLDEPERNGQFRSVLDEALKTASQYAQENEVDPESYDYEITLQGAHSLIDDLRSVFVQEDNFISDDESMQDFDEQQIWIHAEHPTKKISKKKIPYIDRTLLNDVVQTYLGKPWRCRPIDRILVDSLIAVEFYSYADEMLNEKKFYRFPVRSPLKRCHVFFDYLRNLFFNITISLLVIAAAMGIDVTWVNWIASIIVSIWAISQIVETIKLPMRWKAQNRSKSEVWDQISVMANIYNEAASSGIISAKHIYNRLEAATTKGVIWPSALFALLDDILSRDGTF